MQSITGINSDQTTAALHWGGGLCFIYFDYITGSGDVDLEVSVEKENGSTFIVAVPAKTVSEEKLLRVELPKCDIRFVVTSASGLDLDIYVRGKDYKTQ